MAEDTFELWDGLNYPALGDVALGGTLTYGVDRRDRVTIDLRKNKFTKLPEAVQKILRERLPKVARCVSCNSSIEAILQKCSCGNATFRLTQDDWRRITSAVEQSAQRLRSEITREWRESFLPGHYARTDIARIRRIQGDRCYFCNRKIIWKDGREFHSADHLIPITDSRSSNWPSNIVLACSRCNGGKKHFPADDFWRRLEQTKGIAFVREQKVRAHLYDRKRRKLDKRRKSEVNAACITLENRLRAVLRGQKLGGVAVSVAPDASGVAIQIGLATLRLPGSFQSRILTPSKWRSNTRNFFCDQLFDVIKAAGGLVVQPYWRKRG